MSNVSAKQFSMLFIVTALLGLLSLPRPVNAISVDIDKLGNILFYQSSVLGDDEQEKEDENEDEPEVEDKEKEEKREEKTEQKRKEQPIDRVSATRAEKEVKVSVENKDKSKIQVNELRKIKSEESDELEEIERKSLREIEDSRVELQFEDSSDEVRVLKREIEKERAQAELEAQGLSPENRQAFLAKKEEEFQQRLEEKEQEKEQRQEIKMEFKSEKVEIKDEVKDGQRELKIKTSNGFEARLRNADFVVNPDTGAVTVIDANGGEHELLHFPDEALQAVQKNKITLPNNNPEVEIEIQADGSVTQRIKNVVKKQKVFGIFSRDVQGEAVVDDATGEVEFEQEPTLVNQVLSVFSN